MKLPTTFSTGTLFSVASVSATVIPSKSPASSDASSTNVIVGRSVEAINAIAFGNSPDNHHHYIPGGSPETTEDSIFSELVKCKHGLRVARGGGGLTPADPISKITGLEKLQTMLQTCKSELVEAKRNLVSVRLPLLAIPTPPRETPIGETEEKDFEQASTCTMEPSSPNNGYPTPPKLDKREKDPDDEDEDDSDDEKDPDDEDDPESKHRVMQDDPNFPIDTTVERKRCYDYIDGLWNPLKYPPLPDVRKDQDYTWQERCLIDFRCPITGRGCLLINPE